MPVIQQISVISTQARCSVKYSTHSAFARMGPLQAFTAIFAKTFVIISVLRSKLGFFLTKLWDLNKHGIPGNGRGKICDQL